MIFDVSGGRNVDFFAKIWPVIWEFTPTKLFRSYFTICFLPEPGPEERGGGGWDGSRTRPETADLF